MTPVVSLLLLTSMSLIAAGFGLLFTTRHDELCELSPAELSTSAPVARSCWARVQAMTVRRAAPVRRRRSSGPREAMFEMAEISAARTLFAGCVADLYRSEPGRTPTPRC